MMPCAAAACAEASAHTKVRKNATRRVNRVGNIPASSGEGGEFAMPPRRGRAGEGVGQEGKLVCHVLAHRSRHLCARDHPSGRTVTVAGGGKDEYDVLRTWYRDPGSRPQQ